MKSVVHNEHKKGMAYLGLVFVILVWGVIPLVTLRFYSYYSPTIRIAFGGLICAASLMLIARKHLKLLDKTYLKVAIPTGFFMALANILQKIGLQYTTPTHYAFLENLSCLVVPFLLILFIKKKPNWMTILAAVLCLLSSFVLTGMNGDQSGVSVLGDVLCALAGIFYGVNIAATGAFAKKLYAPLYLMLQMLTEMVVSFVGAVAFHVTQIEPIKFSFDWRLILANVIVIFISSTVCWLVRTNAMKQVDATVVAIMMPFSSVVTTILSIIAGTDTLTYNLVIGVVLGLVAIILSGFADRQKITPDAPTAESSLPQ